MGRRTPRRETAIRSRSSTTSANYAPGATCDRSTAFGDCLILCGSAAEYVQVLSAGVRDAKSAETECNGSLRGTWIPK